MRHAPYAVSPHTLIGAAMGRFDGALGDAVDVLTDAVNS